MFLKNRKSPRAVPARLLLFTHFKDGAMPFAPTFVGTARTRFGAQGATKRSGAIDAQNISSGAQAPPFAKPAAKAYGTRTGKAPDRAAGKPIHGIYSNNSRDAPPARYPKQPTWVLYTLARYLSSNVHGARRTRGFSGFPVKRAVCAHGGVGTAGWG